MLNDFSYDEYKWLLNLGLARNKNLRFCDLQGESDSGRYFILRHDIDFSPEAALRMAEFEATLGVRSTYFLLFSSNFYNLLSEDHCLLPRRLAELGHEVGLHYDLKCYDLISREKPSDILQNQADTLGQLSGVRVQSIAMHNPSVYGADIFQNLKQFINAYDPKYAKEIAYISDSCGAWRDDAAALFQKGEMPPRFQLLIHPIFWDNKPGDRWSRMSELVGNQMSMIHKSAEAAHAIWNHHAGVLQHDARKQAASR
ncbi:MAG TPA: hypothetical protein VEG64_12555 [Candidatus Sulfotelmatobacter sp.]|nr:hypothetical protein [Candidatus Sulfotelmatobacter sp.]